ncbi:MAG: hypothetical protein FGM33_08600 [Candidatus Kapabacteria bacterium]|nr:hypothetical protein [Candidatus Kapabacteria bacterium]
MNQYIPLPTLPTPPPFDWEGWYGAVGGRTIDIPEANEWLRKIFQEQYPRFDGDVNPAQRSFTSPSEASTWVKGLARLHGADIVGICRVEPADVYAGRTVPHRFAIVVGARMLYDAFVTVPSKEAAVECLRVYHALGETVIALASDLRTAGHACTIEHPIGDSSVLHIPLALKAGFGELGRHGSIIHPEFGPLFRIGSVLCDLDLACDEPIDAGIGAFCDRCKACRIFCPADAIPDERSSDHGLDPQGNPRYIVDTGKCFPYFARANYCSACLATCAYQHKRWATLHDGSVGQYPTVPFGTVPPAVDPDIPHHPYPQLRRDSASPHHR